MQGLNNALFKMPLKYLFLVMSLFVQSVWANDVSVRQYSDIRQSMHDLASAYPNTVNSVMVGPSDSGEMIEGVVIGNGPVHQLVVATHHGNEYGSTEVGMAVAEALAKNPIAGQSIYVIPVLNIDGYNKRRREEKNASGNSIDPNRDYPGPCGSEGPHRLKSTASLAKFIDRENIITSATLHTYQPAVVYPWGFATQDTNTEYDDLFKMLVRNATTYSKYETGNSGKVIYPANGTFEDYAYWNSGVWSILFELGSSHYPSDANIKEMIRVNVPGIRKMLEESPKEKAVKHQFTGRCDFNLVSHDKHDE